MRALIHHAPSVGIYLYQRTKRFLALQEIHTGAPVQTEDLKNVLADITQPILLVEAGVWPTTQLPQSIPESATGRPLLAHGTGEKCIYLEVKTAHLLAQLLQKFSFTEALKQLEGTAIRVVYLPELNYDFDASLRILQVVTTIQIGGAERVTLDLAQGLAAKGNKVWTAALYQTWRPSFPQPTNFIDLSKIRNTPINRALAIQNIVHHFKIDITHGHLLKGNECAAITALGLPLVVTLHNMPQSWPKGLTSVGKKADLFIACSQEVEKAVRRSPLGRCRTAWNGINVNAYIPSESTMQQALAWRKSKGWEQDIVILTVANPRPQKKLERIPAILKQLQKFYPQQKVRLVLLGATNDSEALKSFAALQTACEKYQIELSHFVGEPTEYLHAADAFLSTSDFEGLSLAQLEALAAGLPLVVTKVGAALEVAREVNNVTAYTTLAVKCPPTVFAKALTKVIRPLSEVRKSKLPATFYKSRMVGRVHNLYHQTLAVREMSTHKHDGIWLVLNNFSMGGAQSSARRFLTDLHARGIKVRVFTVQEIQPTKGTLQLRSQGISVTNLPAFPTLDATGITNLLLNEAATKPPACIIYWNLITNHKISIADAFSGTKTRVVDVSPGEMYFKSLDEYFTQPQNNLPYRKPTEYGRLLSGMVVKFGKEQSIAKRALGCKVSVVRNGIQLQPRDLPNNKKLIFGTAALISPDKRIEDLIETFKLAAPKLPKFELHIAGKIERGADEYYSKLQLQAADLPVVWRGELAGTKDYLKELDIFVMISEPAGCPNASLEALAAGVPSIITNVGGAEEQIINKVNGLITPRRDNQALADAIVELTYSSGLQNQFRKEGPKHIANAFSMESMIHGYLSVCLPKKARQSKTYSYL